MPDGEVNSPGWDAIDGALWPLYGKREPYHVGTVLPYRLGGPDPIHGISAYKNEGPSHWHFITYGFTELWEKEWSDPDVSGYGFELTFRITCDPGEEKPPNWALSFLQNLGRYVFETGNTFGVGHTVPLNGPIMLGADTLIHAASFYHDPQLPAVLATPNGRVEFLQVVGLTMDELTAISSWDAQAFLKLRLESNPLLITDLMRQSWMDDPSFSAEVARRTTVEGSSCGWLNLVMECDTRNDSIHVQVQTIAVQNMKQRLLGRLPYGRELTLNGEDATVVFKPGSASLVDLVEKAVMITLRDDDLRVFVSRLEPHVGVHTVPGAPRLVFEVVRTEIKDRDGKVVEVVE